MPIPNNADIAIKKILDSLSDFYRDWDKFYVCFLINIYACQNY